MRTVSIILALTFIVGLAQGQYPSPKPSPEHEKMKQMEGVWKATVKEPGGTESKGTMSMKMDLGGLWLVSHFKSEKGDFSGRGLDTFDPMTKKYYSVWVDSMSTMPLHMSGEYDKEGKKLVMSGEARGMDGKMQKMKFVTEMKDRNNMLFNIHAPGPDGKEGVMMSIVYERTK